MATPTRSVTGFSRWSLNYVFPAVIFGIDLLVVILMFVNYRNWQSYMSWQIFMIALGLLAMLFAHWGWITRPTVSFWALMVSVLLFLATLILGGKRARTELKRRFHIN